MKKSISLLLLAVLLFGIAGCGKKQTDVGTASLPYKINELGNTVKNIDDIPEWTGKKFDLSLWMDHGTNAQEIGKKPTEDVFREELYRVSGIKIDPEKSFDNNGESGDAKIAKIIATNSWPDIAINVNDNLIKKLANADKIYALDEYISKFAPNYMSIINSNPLLKASFEAGKTDGKLYKLFGVQPGAIKYWDKNYNAEKYMRFIQPEETRAWIWVRDDILKKLYPDAKTREEAKQVYVQNGKFTKEDMSDFVIKSPDELKQLLVKIKNLNLKEGNRPVWPFYTHNGTDNWDLLSAFNSLWGAGPIFNVDYFGYFDMQQKQIVYTIKQPWFKEAVKFYNSLIREGLSSEEALVDNKGGFEQKKNNGEYAVLYGNITPPTDEVLKQAGKPYSYRKVMIDVPMNYDRFIKPNADSNLIYGWSLTVFKNQVKPEDMEQLIRFIDFFYSDAGMKFTEWGPKKAGWFEEKTDGTRRFTNAKIEKNKLYGNDSDLMTYYGYSSWPSLSYFANGANKYNAKILYPPQSERNPNEWGKYWNYGFVEQTPNYPLIFKRWDIWTWTNEAPGLKKIWDGRQSFEDTLKTVFTSKNESEFERYYNNLVTMAERNGLDDTTLKEWNDNFNKVNSQYIEQLKNWKKQ